MRGMDIVDLEPATRELGGLISRTGENELSRPTLCPAYTLGDLIEHVRPGAGVYRRGAEGGRSPH